MNVSINRFCRLMLLCAMLTVWTAAAVAASDEQGKTTKDLSTARELLRNQKTAFVENKGQIKDSEGRVRSDIKFVADLGTMSVFFMNDKISYVLKDPEQLKQIMSKKPHEDRGQEKSQALTMCRVDMELLGSARSVAITGQERNSESINYYIDNSAKGIQTSGYGKLVYRGIYRNTDLVFSITQQGLKYDFVVQPGGDPGAIRWKYAGADGVSLAQDGKLQIATPLGMLEEDIPLTYQFSKSGEQIPVQDVKFTLDNNTAGFHVGNGYNRKQALVIDPRIAWATYYGSALPNPIWDDYFTAVTVTTAGVVAVGYTRSTMFPTAFGLQVFSGGGIDAVIVDFSASGTLLWATYYGGSGDDYAMGVAADAADNIMVTGYTNSPNFPTLGALHPGPLGLVDAFIVHLPKGGAPLNWASYYGGSGNDYGMDIAVNSGGIPAITGYTNSSPGSFDLTPTALQGLLNQGANPVNFDAFVIQGFAAFLNFGTYLGGDANDYGMGIIFDQFDGIALTGYTQGSGGAGLNYPLAGFGGGPAYQPVYAGGPYDAFVTRITNPILGAPAFVWSTYLGGIGDDRGMDLAMIMPNTLLGIVGYTNNMAMVPPVCPMTTGAPGTYDALLLGMDYVPGISTMGVVYGSSGNDYGNDIAATRDAVPKVVITGTTDGANLPMIQPFQPAYAGGVVAPPLVPGDAFVAKFDKPTCSLEWSTYYGCQGNDNGNGIAVDLLNRTVVAGSTIPSSIPGDQIATRSTVYPAPLKGVDGFVCVFENQTRFPTFIGGTYKDRAEDLAIDSNGDIVVTGWTQSNAGFPVSVGAWQTVWGGNTDAFVAKFDDGGNREWITYYGGSGDDVGEGIAVDASNRVAIVGRSNTNTGTAISSLNAYGGGINDGFLAQFNSTGTRQWGCYIGGTGTDDATDVAIDAFDNIVVTGYTSSANGIGTVGTKQPAYAAGCGNPFDAFVVKYNSAGVKQWGSYSGGSDDDQAYGVAIEGNDRIVITGKTIYSAPVIPCTAYPAYGATSYANPALWQANIFVTKFYAGGSSPWSLTYGGRFFDEGRAVAFNSSLGHIYVTGTTQNDIFGPGGTFPITPSPTTNFAPFSNTNDVFLLRFDTLGTLRTAVVRVTTIPGGGAADYADAIALSPTRVAVTGHTESSNLPGVAGMGGAQPSYIGWQDAFVMITDQALTALYGTYFGTAADEFGTGIAFDRRSNILFCGWTNAPDFSTIPNLDTYWALQPANNGNENGFIAMLTPDVAQFAKQTTMEMPFVSPLKPAQYTVYPNPTEGVFTVAGDVAADGHVTFSIADIRGAQVYSSSEFVSAGRMEKRLDISHLAAGNYILRVQIDGRETSLPIVRK